MSLEAILTVMAVILAVIAVIPQDRGQDLRIRLGGTFALVITLATVLVLYWSLLEPLHALPWVRELPRPVAWLEGWGPASASLVIVLGALVIARWSFGRRLPSFRLPRLAAAFANALSRRRLDECVHLLDSHHNSLSDALSGNYWQLKLRKRLFPTWDELHLHALRSASRAMPVERGTSEQADAPTGVLIALPSPPSRPVLVQRLTELCDRPQNGARDVVRAVCHAPDLIQHIARVHPYLGMSLLGLRSSWIAREFAEAFSRALVADRDSALFRELRRAENIDSHNVPIVNADEQPLLSMLCQDALRDDGPRLLYTFLDAGIDTLRSVHGDPSLKQEMNGPLGDYYERTRWYSPPFVTIRLLEITAPRNAVSAEAHTLNLFVVSSLVEVLLQQLSPSAEVDMNHEWPTPTHYLIYASVSFLVDTVEIWRDREEDIPQEKLQDVYDGLPNVLPAHAIGVLGRVMYQVLRSPRLDERFKGYLLEVWWSAFWEKYKQPWKHSETVLSSLVRGGFLGSGDMHHRDGIAAALEHVDIMTQISEGGDRVRDAFGLPSSRPNP